MRLKETHMGEQAPRLQRHRTPEANNPQFELIHLHFDRDPNGHLYSAIWDFEIDIHDLTHRRNPTDKERNEAIKANDIETLRQYRPVITSGTQLLNDIFIQVEFLHPPERLREFEEGRNVLMHAQASSNAESNHYVYIALDRSIRLHERVKANLNSATEYYYSNEYWDDPARKRGLNTDNIELLYDYTAPFEGQGLLDALDKVEVSRAFTQDITFEANRIARIMVAKENNII